MDRAANQSMTPFITRRHFARSLATLAVLPAIGCGNAATPLPKPWTPWTPNMQNPPDMTPDRAYALYLVWKKFVGPVRKDVFTGIDLQKNGSFKAIHGAAQFDYNFETKVLMAMRVLVEGDETPLRPDAPGLIAIPRLGAQEPYTMGGGVFYLNPKPWLTDLDKARSPNKNALCLRRDFADKSIPDDRFLLDLRWLVFWGYYWAPRYGQLAGVEEDGIKRAFRPPEYLERTRPALEKFARGLLAKGEPPAD